MKFGKRMRSLASKAWEAHYVDYKQLKRVIKVLTDEQNAPAHELEAAFRSALQHEIAKVNAAHETILNELALHELTALSDSLGQRWVLPPAKARTLLVEAVEISHKIDAFRRFVVLNSLAIVKITKKFDKSTGLELKTQVIEELKSQSFYGGAGLDDVCDKASALMDRIMLCVLPDGNFRINTESSPCPICLSASMKSPITLSCAHTFCWSCLSKAAEHRFHSCPLCRKEQSIDPRDYEIDGLMKRFKRAYQFVEESLDKSPLSSSRMRPILAEAFDLVNSYIAEVEEQYANITPRTSVLDLTAMEAQAQRVLKSKVMLQAPSESSSSAASSPEPQQPQGLTSFAKGDAVEISFGEQWYPGMIMQCNDDSTYSVLWWVKDNSQRFGQHVAAARLREPVLFPPDSSYMLFDFAAGAWKTATEWAMSPFRRLHSFSMSDNDSCYNSHSSSIPMSIA
ncbi:TPA: hypothetical protein N0F65_007439 [Lagenidium giganteum]|uniref:RING-type domain-containing protein n=1 Tax=Lagenidium giganteum TaxID=4803 RepID=A0AAV2ZLU8_9STRA|nr:TPA: hypothetical protein N0F65_007439 [Lagenidium giganteum]